MEWAELKELLRTLRGYIFRGQRSARWRLETSLERHVKDASNRGEIEERLLNQFEQVAHNFLDASHLPTGRLDWFGCMQHHGAPTRLLDFTRSPYVATYFAVEECTLTEDCAVWALHERECHDLANAYLRSVGFGSEQANDGLAQWIYRTPWPPHTFAAPAGLIRLSVRQVAQQAIFVLPGDVSVPFERNLGQMVHGTSSAVPIVKCFRIPGSQRAAILADLRLMNISRASLFPGLDGFAQSLKYDPAE
jgi:hypothetical protein